MSRKLPPHPPASRPPQNGGEPNGARSKFRVKPATAPVGAETPPGLGRLLPGGRLAPLMPWILGMMAFVAILASAAGIALGGAATGITRDLTGRVTVQIVEADPELAQAMAVRLSSRLGKVAGVVSATPVPPERLRAELSPWLGKDSADPELPVPALIDVVLDDTLSGEPDAARQALRASIDQTLAPVLRDRVQIDTEAQWLAPVLGLIEALRWLAVVLALLTLFTMVASVILAARAALNTHRATIDVLHLMGASDAQIALVFQWRAFLDALIGAGLGLVCATPVLLLIGWQFGRLDAAIVAHGALGWAGWGVILLLPLCIALLVLLTARLTVLRALARLV